MRKVSLERYYFVLYDCALTSKISKMALKSFCDKSLHIYLIDKVMPHATATENLPELLSLYFGRILSSNAIPSIDWRAFAELTSLEYL